MGTLNKVRLKMKLDKDLRQMLVRGSRHEILLDVDGDKEPDIGLLDDDHDGDIDTIALDLTGDNEFNLYIKDADKNGVPDTILFDENGDGNMEVLHSGDAVEQAVLFAAEKVEQALMLEDYVQSQLADYMKTLEKEVRKARKALKRL